jgi:hypothetical protein
MTTRPLAWVRTFAVWAALAWAVLAGATPAAAQQWTAAPEAEPVELPAVPPEWITVPGTWLQVHGDEANLGLMLHVARHGSEALPELAERLKVPVGTTVHVYVADDDAVFRSIQPHVPPTWADATAWPTLGAVFLRTPAVRGAAHAPLEQVLEHELVHVLLGRAFAPQRPPHWLQEGVAQLLAGEIGPEEARTLQQAEWIGGPIPLRSLEHGFPADPRQAQLAYAEAADFVAWLVDEHGEQTLPTLVRASAGGATMRQAVRRATGRFLEDVEADWQGRWAARPGIEVSTFASADWLFAIGAGVLAVAFVLRRRRFHRRVAEMAEEEALVDSLLASYHSAGPARESYRQSERIEVGSQGG